MTDKEMILNLIVNASNELIKSNILIYPDGGIKKEDISRFDKSIGYNSSIGGRIGFSDINNYRSSLITLIELLKPLYLKCKELNR